MRPFAPLLLVAGLSLGGPEVFAQGYLKPSGNGGTVGTVTQFIGGKEAGATTTGQGATHVPASTGLRLPGAGMLGENSEAKLITVPKSAQTPPRIEAATPARPDAPVPLRGVASAMESPKLETKDEPREEIKPPSPPVAEKREAVTRVAQAETPAIVTRSGRRLAPRKPFESLASRGMPGVTVGKIDGSPFEELN